MAIVRDPGRREASVVAVARDDDAHRTRLTEVLVDNDESLLQDYLRDEASLSYPRLREQLAVHLDILQDQAERQQERFAESAASRRARTAH